MSLRQSVGHSPKPAAEAEPDTKQSISLHVHCHVPGQQAAQQIRCPAGTQAAELLRLCGGGDLWQSKDVLMVSQGRVILPDDLLQEGMTLDILPLVDGG